MLRANLAALLFRRVFRGALGLSFLLGVVRCAPEYTFESDGDGAAGSGSGELPAHCRNGALDAGESGPDCGGECPPCTCVTGLAECDGNAATLCETNTVTDPKHCGQCSNACALDNAVQGCVGGQCTVRSCNEPFDDCNNEARDGCEVDLASNPAHCGGCNERCNSINGTPTCVKSRCAIECDPGWADCNKAADNGCETATSRDVTNCGGCGEVCEAPKGETAWCANGECGSTACDDGLGDCDGDGECEQDLANDPENCGYCGNTCIVRNGLGACVEGVCEIDSCDDGFQNCDTDEDDGGYTNGCESNIDTDLRNCGACGESCSIGNATAQCLAGECRVRSCVEPYADCDGDGLTCEIDTSSNATNCGGCGASGGANCTEAFAVSNALGACRDNRCEFAGCLTGFVDCNDDDLACEVDRRTDEENCGGCNIRCQVEEGTVSNTCTNATCRPECAAGWDNCNNVGPDGCETEVLSDVRHCGGCGKVCSIVGALDTRCTGGACVPRCAEGRGDCDENGQNGCEVDTTADEQNCGACGVICRVAGGTRTNTCDEGVCVPVCEARRDDCDNKPENGCETSLSDNDAHCGACGRACQSGAATHASANTCEGTTCEPVCETGWGACGNTGHLGCTIPLNTAQNCGACGNACSGATPLCVDGTCQARIAVLEEEDGGANGSTTRFDLPLLAGRNRMVLIAVAGRGGSGVPAPFEQARPETVRFGGQAAVAAGQHDGGPTIGEGQAHFFFYYVLEDVLATLGTGAKQVEIIAAVPQASLATIANAVLFSGVRQEMPISFAAGRNIGAGCVTTQPSQALTIATRGSVIYSMTAAQYTPLGETTYGPETPLERIMWYEYRPSGGGNPVQTVQGGFAGVATELVPGMTTVRWRFDFCSNSNMYSAVIHPAQAD